jgi:hemolysin activation/secretion protein
MAPNPPIEAGDFGGLLARLEGRAGRARWELTADGLSDFGFAAKTARLYGQWRQPIGVRTGLTLRARGGIATQPTLPQLAYRAGGQGSVRGYDYGTQRGPAFWVVQGDLSPFRREIRPVFFLDAGQAGKLDSLGHSRVLVGGGVGVSFFKGLLRFDLSHPISYLPAGSGLRFDVVFGASR